MIYIIYPCPVSFLCRLRSIATHRDHFVRRPSVCLSVCHTFQSYVLQATHAFLGMLPLFFPFDSFFPLDSFCPRIILPLEIVIFYIIYPCPLSFSPLNSFCPRIILPPGNHLMIYTIYACPISFFPLDLPPYHFAPVSFCHLERNFLMIYTIYPCPVSFCPLDWTLGVWLLCFNRMLGQMSRCSDFTIVMFLFVLLFHTNKKPYTSGQREFSCPWTEPNLTISL